MGECCNVVIELALLDISHANNTFCILKVFFSISGRLLDFGICKVYFYLCLYTKSLFRAIRLTNSPFISSLRVIMQCVVDRSRLHDL